MAVKCIEVSFTNLYHLLHEIFTLFQVKSEHAVRIVGVTIAESKLSSGRVSVWVVMERLQ